MKILFFILVTLVSNFTFAQASHGNEIKPLLKNGKLSIGVQYTSDFLSLTAAVLASDLETVHGAKVYAYFVKKASEISYSNLIWQHSIEPKTPAGTTYVVHMGLSGAAAAIVVSKLNSMVVELTMLLDDGSEKKAFIDLGALCATNPDNFLNIETAATGCQ